MALLRALGPQVGTNLGLNHAKRARRFGRPDLAAAIYAEDVAVVGTVEPSGTLPDLLEGLAEVAALAGTAPGPERAAQLFGAAEALRGAGGSPRSADAEPERDRALAALRAQLGEAAFTAALQAGRSMTLEATIAAALAEDAEPSRSPRPRASGAGTIARPRRTRRWTRPTSASPRP